MADFGLQVFNANGYLQIDSTYANLALRQKGSFVSGGAASSTGWYKASLTVPYGVTPLLAVRPSSGMCSLISSSVSGSNITYLFYCSASAVTLSYWLFDSPAGIAGSGSYGLIVNNASGVRVFDSRMPYLRILDFINGSATGPTLSANYGKTIAVVQTELWYAYSVSVPPYPQTGGIINFDAMAFSISSGNAFSASGQLLEYSLEDPAPDVNTTPRTSYAFLVVDVTNL
ncbi:hypothetical protein QCE63_04900 [Caballeronia sp. LZ065]|uniref:hypothetical protein n=1 Tax=Caballeronia sp. LZ065 TaxID=3038571 RepID=UPI0028601FD9|nr:hypothetical protein [Caballeronia sp. LZ065]MDR5778769.1 hypothetical protein [Caballeronia sp. LZ065]